MTRKRKSGGLLALLAILWGFAMPLLLLAASPAPQQDDESKLPPCCRRNGKHQCGMSGSAAKTALAPSNGETLQFASRPCDQHPSSHDAADAPAKVDHALTAPVAIPSMMLASQGTIAAQAESLYRVSQSRSRQKRGPPSFSL